MAKATIGTVSHGTLRNEHLIPAFLDVLADLDMAAHDRIRDNFDHTWDNYDYDSEDADEMLVVLVDSLCEVAPPYCYFGTTEGDGSDFGFWPSIDSLEEDARFDDNVVKVDDLSQVPDAFSGYVMQVSDHGNVTLYASEEGQLSELWSII